MEQIRLGKLIDGDAGRDAIHIAIAPVIAAMDLQPGQHIGLDVDGKASINEPHLGIVDPFLLTGPNTGERFYLCLYPYSITSLRHEWTHPAFAVQTKTDDPKAESIAWLQAAAVQLGVSYDTLISDWSDLVRGDYINNGEHIRDIWYELSDDFWTHRKIVTGVDVADRDRGGFTCSC